MSARGLRSHAAMQQTWTAPHFEEVNLGSEIGTYYEDEDDPSFLFTRKTSIRRRAGAVVPTRSAPSSSASDETDEPCA